MYNHVEFCQNADSRRFSRQVDANLLSLALFSQSTGKMQHCTAREYVHESITACSQAWK
eukprot:m.107863 g.107863  ORF g.107863 m.107863 type:complete len:59 (-) comp21181_c0_seq1:148-324(-)